MPRGTAHDGFAPLTDRLAVAELIGATTRTGINVEIAVDIRACRKGIKVTKARMKNLDITGDQIPSRWNYAVRPRPP